MEGKMRPAVVAIVPAAGSGKRLGARNKKPFVKLAGKPLVVHALKALGSSADISRIIVAVEPDSIGRLNRIIDKYALKKIEKVVRGGHTRSGSVKNCFKAIGGPCDIVLIHDGARPFPGSSSIRDCIRLAEKFGASISAIPSTDTIKLADKHGFISTTLDRSRLWRAQTPQAFKYRLLKHALAGANAPLNATDEALLMERSGKKVKILKGSVNNIKITTREDVKIAEALLKHGGQKKG